MNIFSKLFSSSNTEDKSPDYSKQIEHLTSLFTPDNAQFYLHAPVFSQQKKHIIHFMMIHPAAGVFLFNFFDHDALSLRNVKASTAEKAENDADIKTDGAKNIVMQRFDEIFHTQLSPVRSILICPNLSEGEFDYLDESFHKLIPKNSVLFNDHTDKRYREILLESTQAKYDMAKIKQALFSELIVPETRGLMSTEQESILHLPLSQDILIQGLPGSGKSSTLIAKALYEKMNNPELNLIIFGKRTCHIHHLQSLIFSFVENSHWGLNPADITVSSFDTLQKRSREKEKYDLILCDDMDQEDLPAIKMLRAKNATIISSSHYPSKELENHQLTRNFRLTPAIEAACEGLEVENLESSLSFSQGNIYMNTLVILNKLLQGTPQEEISIVIQNFDEFPKIKSQIDEYFSPITYRYDSPQKESGIGLYPISHLSCLKNSYMIIILEDDSGYDPIEVISRASKKSFILSESEAIYNIITTIQGRHNEPH